MDAAVAIPIIAAAIPTGAANIAALSPVCATVAPSVAAACAAVAAVVAPILTRRFPTVLTIFPMPEVNLPEMVSTGPIAAAKAAKRMMAFFVLVSSLPNASTCFCSHATPLRIAGIMISPKEIANS